MGIKISSLTEVSSIDNSTVLPVVFSGASVTNKVKASTLKDYVLNEISTEVSQIETDIGTLQTSLDDVSQDALRKQDVVDEIDITSEGSVHVDAEQTMELEAQEGYLSGEWYYNGTGSLNEIATKQNLQTKANLASPVFTGTPTAPTPASTDNSTKIATTAFVQAVADGLFELITDTEIEALFS